MGLVYLGPTWMVDLYGKCIGKYTIPMDPMGYIMWEYCSASLPSLTLNMRKTGVPFQ